MEICSAALIPPASPSDVVIVPCRTATGATVAAADATGEGIALARVNQPSLTVWIRDAINQCLQGQSPDRPRPRGMLIERGEFVQDGTRVLAREWYGRGKRVDVARCAAADAAGRLATQLNALLETM